VTWHQHLHVSNLHGVQSREKSPGNSDININDNMGDNSTYVDQMLIEENAVVGENV
jgi:hypothetical protein